MISISCKGIHSLVLDSGPLIMNHPSVSTLLSQAEVLYSIPSVLEEIRDATTRKRLESTLFPFLTIRSPRQVSVKFIQDFARKTGDLEVLSRTDIHLIALAYELECERNHGDWRLRSSPGQKRLNGAPPTSLNERDSSVAVTGSSSKLEKSSEAENTIELGHPLQNCKSNKEKNLLTPTEVLGVMKKLHLSDPVQQISSDDSSSILEKNDTLVVSKSELSPGSVSSLEDESSNEEGWIKPSNLKNHLENDKNKLMLPKDTIKVMQVALITNDFAMQNVLLRMNLNTLSSSLQRISNLRTWILRCHACFQTTMAMERQFCGRCGKPALLRVACSINTNGCYKIHLKKNMQWNTRGNKYSIPKPRAGTSSGKLVASGGKGHLGKSLILAEDQKEYVDALRKERRQKIKNLMDDDFPLSLLSTGRDRRGNRPVVGAGKNVNARKRK